MYPTTAPLNGPGSSFAIAQDRLSLANRMVTLDKSINQMASVVDPSMADLITPLLPSTLQIALPGGTIAVGGRAARVAAMVMPLDPYTDTYCDVTIAGTGLGSDWPKGALIKQSAGTFSGSSALVASSVSAAAALDITGGAWLTSQYSGYFAAQVGGWGPAYLDAAGNGYVVRATPSGGGLFRALGGAANGAALALFDKSYAAGPGLHTFTFSIRAYGSTLQLKLLIDTSSSVVLNYTDVTPTIDPAALFPGFASDGGQVYLARWKWYNENGDPAAGWRRRTTSAGAPPPPISPGGRRVFVVTTTTVPIALRTLYQTGLVSTQIANARQTLAALKAAYL